MLTGHLGCPHQEKVDLEMGRSKQSVEDSPKKEPLLSGSSLSDVAEEAKGKERPLLLRALYPSALGFSLAHLGHRAPNQF